MEVEEESELSELVSGEEQPVRKHRRPAFRRAVPGARSVQSTQEFFRRRPGNASMHSGDSACLGSRS